MKDYKILQKPRLIMKNHNEIFIKILIFGMNYFNIYENSNCKTKLDVFAEEANNHTS